MEEVRAYFTSVHTCIPNGFQVNKVTMSGSGKLEGESAASIIVV